MSISHQDFFRLLPRAIASYPYERSGLCVEVRIGSGSLNIELSDETVNQIASLKLPRTNVTFTFCDVSAEEKQIFLTQFDLSFQRGGG